MLVIAENPPQLFLTEKKCMTTLNHKSLLLAILATLPALQSATAQGTNDRPNIILIMCDDLGYGDLQCYNSKSIIQTPHLNQMASEGTRFTRFYAAAPVCSPTRGSCLTGRHPFRYGIYFANTGHLPQEEITIPELLKPLNYLSGHFGKWHLGTLTKTVNDANRGGVRGAKHFSTPAMHGFDESFVTESKVPTYDPMRAPLSANKNGWAPLDDKTESKFYGTRFWNHHLEEVTENLSGDTSKIVMDRVLPFIDQSIQAQKPFFTTIWFHAPHLPVVADAQNTNPYKEFSTYDRNYYGCITAMDQQIGRLRSYLQDHGIEDNTILWFCSDNGPEGSHGKAPGSAGGLRGRKRSLYEGGVRVPGILVWPNQAPNIVLDAPAVTSDILPSILDLLQLDYPDERPLDGISLLPILSQEVTLRDQPIGFQSAKQIAWHENDFKIYSSNQGKSWELYNLANDPSESHDLSDREPERLKSMVSKAKKWVESCSESDRGMDY